ncbi:GNAT family N-acetyltransferase [Cellulomonas sp. NS3]|uniref:GNAT family N-acetyltransferase n=1 Tax=Cellulomonas sp. NS3 TaxID=2973977 RepID=UPI0021612F6E|nr:GNAT family N-acetyltransferase [Cellulomonas sp. NS3]
MALFSEQADVSVRPAVPGDELAIAAIQLAAWRVAHAETLGADVLDRLDGAAFAERWARAITSPPAPGYRVLVACEGADVVGFAAVAPLPAPEETPLAAPGGELLSLEVAPGSQRAGHGSRLLAAAVDLLREDGAAHVQTWVLDGDSGRARFLASAGLGADDSVRALATGTGPDGEPLSVHEHGWSASI